MSRVRLVSQTLENFQSVRRVDYALENLGLAMVEGVNLDDPGAPSNGSGKSTMFLNGPTWALFGEGRRELSADAVVCDSVGRDCAGTIRLVSADDQIVTIQRFRKVGGKNGLRLWIGAHVADLADAKDPKHKPHEITTLDAKLTQERVEELLGLDLAIWRSAVYRAQDDLSRFAELKDSQQKERLTHIFGLDQIDGWRDAAASRAWELTEKIGEDKRAILRLEAENLEARIADLCTGRESWERSRLDAITAVDAELARLRLEWSAADERRRRSLAAADRYRELSAAPPAIPPLEAEPPRPHAVPFRPSRPEPQRAKPTLPSAPALPVSTPALDLRELEERRSSLLQQATAAATRAQGLIAASSLQASRAQAIRAKRSGACQECGAQLTPEHADREAARLEAESQTLRTEAAAFEKQAAAHSDLVLSLQGEIRRRADEDARSRTAQRQAFDVAHMAWQQQCRDLESQAQQLYERDRAAWQAEQHQLQTQHDRAQQQALSTWQADHAAVSRRNAEAVARSRGDYDARLSALNAEIQALGYPSVDIERIEASGRRKTTERENLAASVWPQAGKLAELEAHRAEMERSLTELRARIERLEQELRLAEFWVEGFGAKGLKSWVLDERLQELTDRANAWIRVLTGGVYWVRFETQASGKKGQLMERFSTRVFRHRVSGGVAEREWNSWSGGQKARVGVGIDLALSDIVSARARRSFGLLVLDEVFSHLDAGGREAMFQAAQLMRRDRDSVVIVDHDIQFQGAFERRLRVELKNEETQLIGAP